MTDTPSTPDTRVYLHPDASDDIHTDDYFIWPGEIDDLVRFVYANQGPLFAEDAVLYRTWNPERGEHLYIRRDVGIRVLGSWETEADNASPLSWHMGPLTPAVPVDLTPTVTVQPYLLTAEDLETIDTALEDMAERLSQQQAATDDYTPDELRDAARRRVSVRRALKLGGQL